MLCNKIIRNNDIWMKGIQLSPFQPRMLVQSLLEYYPQIKILVVDHRSYPMLFTIFPVTAEEETLESPVVAEKIL